MAVISSTHLETADLIVDALYESKSARIKDEPINAMLNCGNQGGFRPVGLQKKGHKYVVLYSSLNDPDWPDNLDGQTGIFTYYGDNKKAGKELHETKKKGNEILRKCFESIHRDPPDRSVVPHFLFLLKVPKKET